MSFNLEFPEKIVNVAINCAQKAERLCQATKNSSHDQIWKNASQAKLEALQAERQARVFAFLIPWACSRNLEGFAEAIQNLGAKAQEASDFAIAQAKQAETFASQIKPQINDTLISG